MTTLGQVVQGLREERGYSISKLQRDADMSYQTVTAIERDEGNPTIATIGKIAAVFGMTAVELVSMVDEDEG